MSDHAPPRPALVALAVGVAVAGVLAVVAPLAGLGLGLIALAIAATRDVRLAPIGVVAVMATAAAAILGPNLSLPQAPSVFAFRVLIVLLGLGVVAYLLMDGRLVVPHGLPAPAGLLLVLAGWTVLSVWWAADTAAAARWTLFLCMMTGLALAIAVGCRTRRRAIVLMIVLGATFALASAVAIAELRFGLRLPSSFILGRQRNEELAASLFGNQNNFATYLTLSLPYFLCLPVVFRDARIQAIGVAGSVLCLGALMFTGSRSNLVAAFLVIGGLVVALATDRRRSGRAVAGVVVAALAALVVIPSLGGGGVIPLPATAVEKFDLSNLVEQRRAGLGSGAVRESVTADALTLTADTGGLGVGAGNAETSLRSLADFTGVENVHNWWLEVLVNLGVVGFALYVAFYLVLLRGTFRAARRSDDLLVQWLGLATGLALVGFVVGSLGPSSVIHFGPMWITFGLGMLAITMAERRPT